MMVQEHESQTQSVSGQCGGGNADGGGGGNDDGGGGAAAAAAPAPATDGGSSVNSAAAGVAADSAASADQRATPLQGQAYIDAAVAAVEAAEHGEDDFYD